MRGATNPPSSTECGTKLQSAQKTCANSNSSTANRVAAQRPRQLAGRRDDSSSSYKTAILHCIDAGRCRIADRLLLTAAHARCRGPRLPAVRVTCTSPANSLDESRSRQDHMVTGSQRTQRCRASGSADQQRIGHVSKDERLRSENGLGWCRPIVQHQRRRGRFSLPERPPRSSTSSGVKPARAATVGLSRTSPQVR